jgi:hypothetical protein
MNKTRIPLFAKQAKDEARLGQNRGAQGLAIRYRMRVVCRSGCCIPFLMLHVNGHLQEVTHLGEQRLTSVGSLEKNTVHVSIQS